VPRSYFLGIYQRASSRGSIDPEEALLQPVIDMHAARIRSLVKNSLGLADDGAVTVEAYEDSLPIATAVPVPPPAPSAAGMPSALLLNTHAREIALAMLAVVALLMVSILLRRGAAPTPVPVTVPLRPMPAAAERHGLLDGVVGDPLPVPEHPHHLDPQAGQEEEARQLFRRARELVNESPDDAARVLRSWIYQDR
jgi:flagellar biosynthesis/type III secretory pathway M-ring protein FliF/YscJ